MPNTPKRRGRPPGPPKEPKPRKKMGRPRKFGPEAVESHEITAPVCFFKVWEKSPDLILDFIKKKLGAKL